MSVTRLLIGLAMLGCGSPTVPAVSNPAFAIGTHHFRSGGVDLVYHVAGHGPACIVHPGGPGIEWTYLQMPDVERRLTLIYVEPVGTGASGPLPEPKGYTTERYAADVETLRQVLGQDRLCLIGHSGGGAVAIEYVIEHPDRVSRLILYATSAVMNEEWSNDTGTARELRANEPWFAATNDAPDPPDSPTHECKKWQRIAPFYFADWTARHAEFEPLVATVRCWDAPGFWEALHQDQRPRLAAVHVATLVAIGRHDHLFPPKWGRITTDAIAGATMVIFEHSGHMAHVEEPLVFADAIVGFVTSVR